MYDSFGKFPTDGMISLGNFWALGSPSSCLEVKVGAVEDGDDHSFMGRYCGGAVYPVALKDMFGIDVGDARQAPPVMRPARVDNNPVRRCKDILN